LTLRDRLVVRFMLDAPPTGNVPPLEKESVPMKRSSSVYAVAAAVWLCAAPASAQNTQMMVATLSGGAETPAPGVLTGAAGHATLSIDQSAQTISVTLNIVNLPTATTAAHIHVGPAGVAGPIIIDFPIPTGRTGDLSVSFRVGASSFRARPELGVVTMADAIQSILAGNAYVNVHTVANGGGEIRGQLGLLP
jgi:hypothetical protein